jgi:hypothetical protein
VGAVGKRLLKVLVFKLLDPIVGAVGDFFARRWEDRYRPHRLRHFTPDAFDKPDPNPLVAADWTFWPGDRRCSSSTGRSAPHGGRLRSCHAP